MTQIADQLINQENGAIDRLAVLECATLRAQREWGGKDYPPCYLLKALEWSENRAQDMQVQWRSHRGLPIGVLVVWVVDPIAPARKEWA